MATFPPTRRYALAGQPSTPSSAAGTTLQSAEDHRSARQRRAVAAANRPFPARRRSANLTEGSWMSLTAAGFRTEVARPRRHDHRVVLGPLDGGDRDGCWCRKLGAGPGGSHRAGLLWRRVAGHLHAWRDP